MRGSVIAVRAGVRSVVRLRIREDCLSVSCIEQ